MSAGKQAAGRAAAALVESGMGLGRGTGSTVAYFLDAVAERGLDVVGVPTSTSTAARCRELGIDLVGLADVAELDLVVVGAVELTTALDLTKGGGGALLREKVVASMGVRFVVIATPDKVVERLGDTFALPVEVVDFAVPEVARRLTAMGADDVARRGGDDYRTDNGNVILDATFTGGIADVDVLDVALALTPGVAEHGLFVGMATEALLGTPAGDVERLVGPVDD